MFIIYNAFAIAVTQRRGEIGLLRALGATRGQVAAAVRQRERRDRRIRRIGDSACWLGYALAGVVARRRGAVCCEACSASVGRPISVESTPQRRGAGDRVGIATSALAAAAAGAQARRASIRSRRCRRAARR